MKRYLFGFMMLIAFALPLTPAYALAVNSSERELKYFADAKQLLLSTYSIFNEVKASDREAVELRLKSILFPLSEANVAKLNSWTQKSKTARKSFKQKFREIAKWRKNLREAGFTTVYREAKKYKDRYEVMLPRDFIKEDIRFRLSNLAYDVMALAEKKGSKQAALPVKLMQEFKVIQSHMTVEMLGPKKLGALKIPSKGFESVRRLRLLAVQNYLPALTQLFRIYREGILIKRDFIISAYWGQRALKQGAGHILEVRAVEDLLNRGGRKLLRSWGKTKHIPALNRR